MKNIATIITMVTMGMSLACATEQKAQDKVKPAVMAETPPMGWNSFDAYSCHLYEEIALKELDVFTTIYAPHGYEYYVIDNGWFAEHERIEVDGYRLPLRQHAASKEVRIDEYGIVQPSKEGFPNGFKPIVDRLHGKGLKFGVHIMRGIPRKAVEQNTPIKGTDYRASDIADIGDTCSWCSYMYGVDMSKPGSQEYYNSLIQQFADWGVDFVKVDDVIHKPLEIRAFREAIDRCDRPMILSLSPGGAARKALVESDYSNANMFRICPDGWDKPEKFAMHMARYKQFGQYSRPGMWADLDMLVLGELCILKRNINKQAAKKLGYAKGNTRFGGHMHHWCSFSKSQKIHFLGLRAIGCSPLMIGGSLITMDRESREMLLDPRFIACNQNGVPGRIVKADKNLTVLAAPAKKSTGTGWIFACNTGEQTAEISLFPKTFGFKQNLRCSRIWEEDVFVLTPEGHTVTVPAYGGVFMEYSTLGNEQVTGAENGLTSARKRATVKPYSAQLRDSAF